MKRLLPFITLLLIILPAFPQDTPAPCTETKPPVLSGLTLGMTAEQVASTLSSIRNLPRPAAQKKGSGVYEVSPDSDDRKEGQYDVGVSAISLHNRGTFLFPPEFEHIAYLNLEFFEQRLYSIFLIYSKQDFEWKDATDLVTHIGPTLGLQDYQWKMHGTIAASLECEGFRVFMMAGSGLPLDIHLVDSTASRRISELVKLASDEDTRIRARTVEEKKKAFKP